MYILCTTSEWIVMLRVYLLRLKKVGGQKSCWSIKVKRQMNSGFHVPGNKFRNLSQKNQSQDLISRWVPKCKSHSHAVNWCQAQHLQLQLCLGFSCMWLQMIFKSDYSHLCPFLDTIKTKHMGAVVGCPKKLILEGHKTHWTLISVTRGHLITWLFNNYFIQWIIKSVIFFICRPRRKLRQNLSRN